MRKNFIFGCIALIAIVAIVIGIFISFVSGIIAFLILTGLFFMNALKKIPPEPPHKGVLVFLGKRQTNEVLDEGWRILPCRPFLFNYIRIPVEKVTTTFGPQKVRTPDGSVISTSEAVIWQPGIENMPESYTKFLNSGGHKGVVEILEKRVEDRVKTWATSNQEGPSTWREAQGLRDDAHAVLAKALLGAPPLTKVDIQIIPTSVWMRFLNKPQSPPTAYDVRPENNWASIDAQGRWNWNGLKSIFEAYSSEDRKTLEEQVKKRREEVDALRSAKGNFIDESLGITILGFSVNEIQVEGKVAIAAENEEEERRQRAADQVEIENISERVKNLRNDHPDLTADEAFQIVQTERGKVKKQIIAVSGAQTPFGNDLMSVAGILKTNTAVQDSANPGNSGKKGGKKPKKLDDLDDNDVVIDSIDDDD